MVDKMPAAAPLMVTTLAIAQHRLGLRQDSHVTLVVDTQRDDRERDVEWLIDKARQDEHGGDGLRFVVDTNGSQ